MGRASGVLSRRSSSWRKSNRRRRKRKSSRGRRSKSSRRISRRSRRIRGSRRSSRDSRNSRDSRCRIKGKLSGASASSNALSNLSFPWGCVFRSWQEPHGQPG